MRWRPLRNADRRWCLAAIFVLVLLVLDGFCGTVIWHESRAQYMSVGDLPQIYAAVLRGTLRTIAIGMVASTLWVTAFLMVLCVTVFRGHFWFVVLAVHLALVVACAALMWNICFV